MATKTRSVGVRVTDLIAQLPDSRRPTDAELAAKLGLHPTAINHWRGGRTSPRDVEAVAKALGVTVAEIYAGRLARGPGRAA